MHCLGEGSTQRGSAHDDSVLKYPSVVCSTSYGMLRQSRESGQEAKRVLVLTSQGFWNDVPMGCMLHGYMPWNPFWCKHILIGYRASGRLATTSWYWTEQGVLHQTRTSMQQWLSHVCNADHLVGVYHVVGDDHVFWWMRLSCRFCCRYVCSQNCLGICGIIWMGRNDSGRRGDVEMHFKWLKSVFDNVDQELWTL